MKKRIIIIVIIILIALAIVWRLASNKKKINEAGKPKVSANVLIPVTVDTVAFHDINNQLVKTGNLVPFREADITAISSGKLVAVHFNLGSYVAQGGIVAQVDTRTLELNLAQAKLSKSKAEKDYERYSKLLEGEATTEVTFQDAKLTAQNAGNQIELLQKQISDNRIKSPISGQVVSKLKESGEFVNLGAVLGHVVDVSRLKVNVLVGEGDVYTLKVGNKVKVTADVFPGKTFDGTVSFISNQGDATHNYQVEILLQNTDAKLKAATFVNVDFSRPSAQKLMTVTRNALVDGINNPMVYLAEDGKAVLHKITLGKELGGRLEVLDGLKEGDKVITGGQINLNNGTPITIAQ